MNRNSRPCTSTPMLPGDRNRCHPILVTPYDDDFSEALQTKPSSAMPVLVGYCWSYNSSVSTPTWPGGSERAISQHLQNSPVNQSVNGCVLICT